MRGGCGVILKRLLSWDLKMSNSGKHNLITDGFRARDLKEEEGEWFEITNEDAHQPPVMGVYGLSENKSNHYLKVKGQFRKKM